tara:strand:+ start:2579 stop:3196 length:618 start_codon:yes stop_codon:yes gene_type:complete
MRDIKIIDNIHTKEDFIKELEKYGTVNRDIDLPVITSKETKEVTEQIWHQDGLQIENQPQYQALWCSHAEEECPSTQYISTRISEEEALKHIDVIEGYEFKEAIDDGLFYRFEKESHKRYYLKKIYKGKRPIILQDDIGYYTRWCPMSSYRNESLEKAVFKNEIQEIEWISGRVVISNNIATLHRRTPNKNVAGTRSLYRAYVHI